MSLRQLSSSSRAGGDGFTRVQRSLSRGGQNLRGVARLVACIGRGGVKVFPASPENAKQDEQLNFEAVVPKVLFSDAELVLRVAQSPRDASAHKDGGLSPSGDANKDKGEQMEEKDEEAEESNRPHNDRMHGQLPKRARPVQVVVEQPELPATFAKGSRHPLAPLDRAQARHFGGCTTKAVGSKTHSLLASVVGQLRERMKEDDDQCGQPKSELEGDYDTQPSIAGESSPSATEIASRPSSAGGCASSTVSTAASPRRPPGKPPSCPPHRRLQVRTLPEWHGPRPDEGWKSQRVINWQPMRRADQWEGSVWQRIHCRMQERGAMPLDATDWNDAFMRRRTEKNHTVTGTSEQVGFIFGSPLVTRVLPDRVAFKADLCMEQLVRMGFKTIPSLAWVVGGEQQSSLAEGSPREVPEPALEALQGLLAAAIGFEAELTTLPLASSAGEGKLPLSEVCLRQLFRTSSMYHGGGLAIVRAQVADALWMSRFDAELARLESQCSIGIRAAKAVMVSEVVPTLLEGVLVLGNYVNASSSSLGQAVGVSLDSIPKLAHTRCLVDAAAAAAGNKGAEIAALDQTSLSARRNSRSGGPGNALELLLGQLRLKYGAEFMDSLSADVLLCAQASEVNSQRLRDDLMVLVAGGDALEDRMRSGAPGEVPPALAVSRLGPFMSRARERLLAFRSMLEDLDRLTAEVRIHFAELPERRLQDMFSSLAALAPYVRVISAPTARATGGRSARRPHPSIGVAVEPAVLEQLLCIAEGVKAKPPQAGSMPDCERERQNANPTFQLAPASIDGQSDAQASCLGAGGLVTECEPKHEVEFARKPIGVKPRSSVGPKRRRAPDTPNLGAAPFQNPQVLHVR